MTFKKKIGKELRASHHLLGRSHDNSGPTSLTSGGNGGCKGKAAVGTVGQNDKAKVTNVDPFVLLLSFGYADTFNSIHKHFLAALRSRAEVVQPETKESALQSLARPEIIGVFITDPEVVEKKYATVVSRLVQYVKAGGTVVIGGTFSTFVRPSDNDTFFKKAWGLNWKMGSYHRTTFSLNPSRPERLLRGPSLAASYSMKTVHLKGIAPETVVYGPTSESRTQSMVFSPSPVDLSEAPVVYTRVEKGYLGYIGDVNGEEESTNVILSMLGLPEHGKKTSCGRQGDSGRQGRGRGSNIHHDVEPEWEDEYEDEDDDDDGDDDDDDEWEERAMNGGYTQNELNELLCQGIKPWDEW